VKERVAIQDLGEGVRVASDFAGNDRGDIVRPARPSVAPALNLVIVLVRLPLSPGRADQFRVQTVTGATALGSVI
jgi:hypothetical protein